MFHIKTNVNLMKNLEITKKLRAFWRHTAYACMVSTSVLMMSSCSDKSVEQITPQTQQTSSLAKEFNLKAVTKPADTKAIVYLKDMEKAHAFFQNLKVKKGIEKTIGLQSGSRINNDLVLSHGFFTFLNGQTATIHFNTYADGIGGEVVSASMNGESLTFTQYGNYVQMFKWGIIAIPKYRGGMEGTDLNGFMEEYEYYYAPVAIYSATLMPNGWSSVQLLSAYEQANFDGEGNWEAVYIPNPNNPGNDLPVTDPWFPQSVQGQ
jgi:hypothetical protein